MRRIPKSSPMDAHVTMMDLYETHYGICNHLDPNKNPLSSVLHHPPEEYWMNSSMVDIIEEFALGNLGELFNMSLVEYLSLPKPQIELLRKVKDSIIAKKNRQFDDAGRALKGL